MTDKEIINIIVQRRKELVQLYMEAPNKEEKFLFKIRWQELGQLLDKLIKE